MRKALVFLLAAVFLLSAAAPARAAAPQDAAAAAEALYEKGLFLGTGTDAQGRPRFELDRAPTRAEGVTMLIRLLGMESAATKGRWQTPFTDVPGWAEPYVGCAYANGLTEGVSQTTFDSESPVTATQYLTFLLRALGYSSDTDFRWDAAWELSDAIGLTADDHTAADNSAFLRADAAVLSLRALSLPMKDSGELLGAFLANGRANVPVLMYHNVSPTGSGSTNITPALFEAHLAALRDGGYTAVMPDDLLAYVNEGKPLPAKPVVITFDDGYYTNYETAYPLLKAYGMRATMFIPGVTTTHARYYKDTAYEMTPHFDFADAAEMAASGVVSVQSHTYDMHQWPPFESGDRVRSSAVRFPDETEEEFRAAMAEDIRLIREAITGATGERVHVFAYPNGRYDALSQQILAENGFDVTFTTRHGSNIVTVGDPSTLMLMDRFTMSGDVSVETLLQWVSVASGG